MWIVFPLHQILINLSFKQFHTQNHIFGCKDKQKITFSGIKSDKKSHFRAYHQVNAQTLPFVQPFFFTRT